MRNIILFLSIACLSVMPLHAQTKKEQRKQKEAEEFINTKSLIESGSFQFIPAKALPAGGRIIDITGHNAFVEVSNDSATAALPFFGTASDAAYSTDQGGIKFDGEMEGFDQVVNEKNSSISLTFRVKSGRDTYNCHFTIMSSSTGTLSITSNVRSQMSYDGRFSAMEE